MISFEYDKFITDQDKTVWIATLSDGREVFQDDYRNGLKEWSAWVRLGEWLKEHPDIRIDKLRLRFRSHTEWVNKDTSRCQYLFFSNAIFSMGLTSYGNYMIGFGDDKAVVIQRWKVPEVIKEDTEIREISKCHPRGLIKNGRLES